MLCLSLMFALSSCTKSTEADSQRTSENCDKSISIIDGNNFNSVNGTTITDASIVDECLSLTVQYAGGCEEHDVQLALTIIPSLQADGDYYTPIIIHDNQDMCEALITESISYDLSSIPDNGTKRVIVFEAIDKQLEL